MACDAIARLYDVDEDSAVFTKLDKTKRYDQGTFTFHARKGRLIDLDKLHESVWATRLSGGTRSGLVSLEVTAIGQITVSRGKTMLAVSESNAQFELGRHPDDKNAAAEFGKLQTVSGDRIVKLTGIIDNYKGRWPNLLKKRPPKPRRLLVTGFEVLEVQ